MLLRITAKAGKRNPALFRLIISAALGGLYSMIILIDDIQLYITALSKIAFSVLIMLISFGFTKIKSFFSMLLIFLFSNFLFLGIITGLQMIFKSDKIITKNGEVYFDISARELLLTALVAYIASCVIIRIYNKRLSAGEIYNLIIVNNSKEISVFALSDTGNKLREPFSNYPVIIVKKEIAKELFDEKNARLIPASTINSSSYLKAYKPECVKVKTAKGYEKIENVFIALSDDLDSKNFSAVINPEIISV